MVSSRLLKVFLLVKCSAPTSYVQNRSGKRNKAKALKYFQNSTFPLENVKQGILIVLKKRFPTISAAIVLAILRHERNLSSQEQCITVWILTLVRPYLVCPGSILMGHPRSWCLQHLLYTGWSQGNIHRVFIPVSTAISSHSLSTVYTPPLPTPTSPWHPGKKEDKNHSNLVNYCKNFL